MEEGGMAGQERKEWKKGRGRNGKREKGGMEGGKRKGLNEGRGRNGKREVRGKREGRERGERREGKPERVSGSGIKRLVGTKASGEKNK